MRSQCLCHDQNLRYQRDDKVWSVNPVANPTETKQFSLEFLQVLLDAGEGHPKRHPPAGTSKVVDGKRYRWVLSKIRQNYAQFVCSCCCCCCCCCWFKTTRWNTLFKSRFMLMRGSLCLSLSPDPHHSLTYNKVLLGSFILIPWTSHWHKPWAPT